MGQVANASANEILTDGEIIDEPGTSDDTLENVDNTIRGGGVIRLDTFDDQANGWVEAIQRAGSR